MKKILLVVAAALLWTVPVAADEEKERAEFIRANYSKYEYRIPMRDGVKLFTSVYIPNELDGSWPIMLVRTPYSVGPYGVDRYRDRLGPSHEFEKEKFIFAFQDVRGRYMSEGEYDNMRPSLTEKKDPKAIDESTDAWDTIDWLVKNVPKNNGKVGTIGISYPGFYVAAGMIDSHPALKAASPQAPIADWFWDDMHRHGAFTLALAFNFFSSFGQPRPEPTTEDAEDFEFKTADAYQFYLDMGPLKNADEKHLKGEVAFWKDIVAHPNYDEFWQSRNLLPHLKKIKAAVLTVGGFYDMEDLYGPLKIYRQVEKNNPSTSNQLVMGPWRHGGWQRGPGKALGTADFGFATSKYYQEKVELAFFKHHLKGATKPDLPEALIFETGANRWRSFETWPPKEMKSKKLYLKENGGLGFEPSATEGSDSYPSDPAKPVPYTQAVTTGWNAEFMTEDQRFAGRRPDVLVYQTEELKEDVTLVGPLMADLWVSITGQDADFVVKFVDVYPGEHPDAEDNPELRTLGAQQMLVRGEAFRGRFRNSYSKPEPFTPDEATRVRFELQDILHTFKRGHRIMIQVQSSWFPLIDRNPQSWVDNIFEAKEEDFIKATHTVHRAKDKASLIEVGVLTTP